MFWHTHPLLIYIKHNRDDESKDYVVVYAACPMGQPQIYPNLSCVHWANHKHTDICMCPLDQIWMYFFAVLLHINTKCTCVMWSLSIWIWNINFNLAQWNLVWAWNMEVKGLSGVNSCLSEAVETCVSCLEIPKCWMYCFHYIWTC